LQRGDIKREKRSDGVGKKAGGPGSHRSSGEIYMVSRGGGGIQVGVNAVLSKTGLNKVWTVLTAELQQESVEQSPVESLRKQKAIEGVYYWSNSGRKLFNEKMRQSKKFSTSRAIVTCKNAESMEGFMGELDS